MTHEFHAPPPDTVIEDTPFGHALIKRYMPWLLAHREKSESLRGISFSDITTFDIEKRRDLPWIIHETDQTLSHLFTQDTELPMAVPPIGTVVDDRNYQEFMLQYPAFDKYLDKLEASSYYEHVERTDCGCRRIITHPPHSVAVPFVEPVKAETETPETKESEEPIVTKSIVTAMQKILRPEIGQIINTPEEVEKFKVFLFLHTNSSAHLVARNGAFVWHSTVLNCHDLPYTVKGVNPDYGDIFITEAELAQAETQQVEAEKAKSLLLPTVELLQNRVRELEKELIHDLIPLKNNVNTLFQLMGEQKPF